MSFFSDLSVSGKVQALYVAYYGRPADPAGLTFWANQINIKGINNVINAFGSSPEAVARFDGLTDRQKVLDVYRAVLGREGDDVGVTFYAKGLSNGSFTLASLALNVVDGVVARDDIVALNFRLQAANDFSRAINTAEELQGYSGSAAITVGTSFLKPINNLDSYNAADADAAVASLQPGIPFTLTTADDTFINTSGRADIFTAAVGTLNANDVIVDKFVGDGDVLNATLNQFIGAPRIEGIEKINLTWDAFDTALYDALKTKGATITGTSTKLGFLGDFTVFNSGSNNVVAGSGMKGALAVTNAADNVVTATAASSVSVSGTGSTKVVAGVTTSKVSMSGFNIGTIDASIAAKNVEISASNGGDAAKLAVQIGDDAKLVASGYGVNSVITTTVANGKVLTLDPSASTANFVIAGPGAATVKLNYAAISAPDGIKVTKATSGKLTGEFFRDVSDSSTNALYVNKLGFDVAKFTSQLGEPSSNQGSVYIRSAQQLDFLADNNIVNVVAGEKGVTGASIMLSSANVGSFFIVSPITNGDFGINGVVSLVANAPTATGDAKNIDLTIAELRGDNLSLSGSNDVEIKELAALSFDAAKLTGNLKVTSTSTVNNIVGSTGDNTISFASSSGQRSVTTQGGKDSVSFGAIASGSQVTAVTDAGNDVIKATLGSRATFVVEAGAGDDRVELMGSSISDSNIVMDFGSGTDTLAYSGSLISGNIAIRGLEALEVTSADATIAGKLVNGQNYSVSASGTGALFNVQADTNGDTIDVSNLSFASSITGTEVVGSAKADTITLGARSTPDVVAGLGGNDLITIKNDGGLALDEVHFRSIDGTDTVTGLNLGSTTPSANNDFIAFLDNGNALNGSVNFDATDTTAGPFGTRFLDTDTTSYGEFGSLDALAAALGQSNKVLVINDSAAVISTFASISPLTNAYIIVANGTNDVSIYFDNNWADINNRVEIAKLVGVTIGQLDATDFGVYSAI